MGATTCKNCGTNFVGNYCPHCGQKATVNRITLKRSLKEGVDIFFNLNRGLIPTSRDLLLRPGSMLSGYIAGRRRKYVHPVRFMLAVIAFSYLTYFVLFPDGWMMDPSQLMASQETKGMEEYGQWVLESIAKNYTLITLSIVPFLAVWYRIFFRKNGYNLGEHLTVLTYVSAMTTLLPVVFLVGIYAEIINPSQFLAITYVIYLGYTSVAMILWIKPRQRVLAVLKSLFAYAFGLACWGVLFGLSMSVLAFNKGILKLEDFEPVEETTAPTVPNDSLSMDSILLDTSAVEEY